jgi:membrane protein DedA with SNARE-associated domain
MVAIPIVETVVNVILWVMAHLGLPGLLLLMTVESFGIPPLPSEIILPFAGFLVATGVLPLDGVIVAALAGGLLGSYLAYLVGRYARHWLIRGPRFLRLEPAHLERMDRWFARHGEGTVIGAGLLPVVRSYISYPAGAARMPPLRFGVYSLAGATPFTLALIYVGILLGKNWDQILPIFHLMDYAVLVVLAGGVIYLVLLWKNVLTPGWPPHRTA